MPEIDVMIGKTIKEITGAEADEDTIIFVGEDGTQYVFDHEQDCCESVLVEEVIGDIADLIGTQLLQAEEVSSDNEPAPEWPYDSYTWTFYKFATIKGSVTIRWLGASNGYYSESVRFSVQ